MTTTTTATDSAARHSRQRLRTRVVLAGLCTFGIAALAWPAFVRPLPRLIYNPSDSVAVGWYRVDARDLGRSLPSALSVSSIVLTALPPDAAALAAQRGYLPTSVPLLKRVGAIGTQHVCVLDGLVWIDGIPQVAVQPADRLGRPLPYWAQCRRLAPDELFLLGVANPASFDSRYFGPIKISTIIGIARPIWQGGRR